MINKDLFEIISELKVKITENMGLGVFVQNRSKFEGWLKVELVNLMVKYNLEVTPEKNFIDIVSENTLAIELKTVNTSYKFKDTNLEIKDKTRPITDNINSIIKDIEGLNNSNYKTKMILFTVFPLDGNNSKQMRYWEKHKIKIQNILNTQLESCDIEFKTSDLKKIPGKLCYAMF